jgi:parallel beta helix pectate lyase-like protein
MIRKGAVATLFAIVCASAAFAQSQRTFVSAHSGSDANPCNVIQPCRNFSAAMAQTLAGGEIIVLDSAGYGPVSIDKSVSIVSPAGVYAGVTAFSGNAITINTASLTVVLEGLTLNGLGGANGIGQALGGTLYVKRLVITGFSNDGISINSPDPVLLFVAETDIRNNSNGMYLRCSSGANRLRVSLDHVRTEKNYDGVHLDTQVLLSAYECVFAENASGGFAAPSLDSAANLESCLIAGNSYGVGVLFGTVRISNCMITDNNAKGILDAPGNGSVLSRQNNTIEGNVADDTPGMYTGK